ncbi:MAG TPA: hypothetical protein VLK36_07815 [Gaiellaceae bacterium]|nr:hypothetical protein [Gaiellaceae bacterium]
MAKHLCRAALASALLLLAVGVVGASASSNGMFVIGDGNTSAGSQVTFWGAQWWKDNSLSTGDAPAGFKGYAVDVNLSTCTFTSVKGNSAPPPDGPLPPVIDVLVTSSVTQSGSKISGTVVGVAHVATADGYDSNPGHAGTGSVLGFVPCGTAPDSF